MNANSTATAMQRTPTLLAGAAAGFALATVMGVLNAQGPEQPEPAAPAGTTVVLDSGYFVTGEAGEALLWQRNGEQLTFIGRFDQRGRQHIPERRR